MIDSDDHPLLVIVPGKSKVNHRKIKNLLVVRDARLASPDEVLRHSRYPAGGVPPFNDIKRVFMDPHVLENETSIVSGGDVDKLLEIKTRDIVEITKARILDITQSWRRVTTTSLLFASVLSEPLE